MNIAPRLKDMKTALGQWKPRGDAGAVSRMPRADVLKKSKFWTESAYAGVRQNLQSRPLTVEISDCAESVKVEVPGGGSSIIVIPNRGPLPASAADIPFSAIVLDVRRCSVEDTDLLRMLPGRSRFASVPTLLFGGIGEAEEFRRAVNLVCGSHWAGEVRPVDVYTSETSNQFTFQRRRLLCMVPTGRSVNKLPPTFNIAGSPTLTEGWCTVLGLMRHLWHQEGQHANTDVVDWLYVISDDPGVPALLSQHMELKPSLVWCTMKSTDTVRDLADRVAEGMRLAQDLPPLNWEQLTSRWTNMMPLFRMDAAPSSGHSSDSDSSESERTPPPKPAPKPAAVKAPAPKAKRQPKPKAVKPNAAPAAGVSPPTQPDPAPEPTPAQEPSSSSSRRNRDAATEREAQRDRDRAREEDRERDRRREREAEREAERERERRREQDRRDRREEDRRREAERDRDRDSSRSHHSRDSDRDRHSVVRRSSTDSSDRSRGGELQRRLGNTGFRRR